MENISNSLPDKSGVYIFKQKCKILYIGKAKNLKKRVASYFRTGIGVWKEDMITKADSLDYFLTNSEQEALVLEEKLVKKNNPPYNCLLKGDNAYTYIKIGKEDFPNIEFTRRKSDNKSLYIGPKAWKKDLKNTLQILRYIFKFRACSKTKFNKHSLCSDFTMGLCAGYCSYNSDGKKLVKSENILPYKELKENYKKNINIIKNFFDGRTNKINSLILEKINQAIEKQNFEYANLLKNIYIKLEKMSERQTIEFDEKINGFFIKIREFKNTYFMICVKFVDGKLIDIVKTTDSENNFLKNMISDEIIQTYNEISENFYFAQ